MKRVLFAVFLLSGVAGAADTDTVKISTDAVFFSTVSITSSYTLTIGYDTSVCILRIDKDGDIFLRRKWIGWDGRLADILKANGATSYEFFGESKKKRIPPKELGK